MSFLKGRDVTVQKLISLEGRLIPAWPPWRPPLLQVACLIKGKLLLVVLLEIESLTESLGKTKLVELITCRSAILVVSSTFTSTFI